jgi:hypothetical protein
MTYSKVTPPLALTYNMILRSRSKDELNAYYKWYLENIPVRIKILTEAIHTSPGFEQWHPNIKPQSLKRLGDWFYENAKRRPLTQNEKEYIISRQLFPIEVQESIITWETLSIAIDVGMYLGQVFRKQFRFLQWIQMLDDKRDADYGQPVLAYFGENRLNPSRIACVLAVKFTWQKEKGDRLLKVYEHWAKMVQPSSRDAKKI